MRVTKRQLRRIIRESLIKEYNGYGPGSRNEPGHKDPESGNWVDPGMPGYNPRKDKTLTDGGWGEEEYSKALRAHLGGRVDPNWKHPQYR